ncbi:hypothetical protein D3C72_1327060 [compost metagenome]
MHKFFFPVTHKGDIFDANFLAICEFVNFPSVFSVNVIRDWGSKGYDVFFYFLYLIKHFYVNPFIDQIVPSWVGLIIL